MGVKKKRKTRKPKYTFNQLLFLSFGIALICTGLLGLVGAITNLPFGNVYYYLTFFIMFIVTIIVLYRRQKRYENKRDN